jgi:glycosyltransferase involved in cell wall biosynthesis
LKLLFIQETDWLKRGPHQQHHLAERLSIRGHEIRVIDHDFTWRASGNQGLFSHRKVFENVAKVDDRAKVTVIRPGIVKFPVVDNLSLVLSHRREINRQIKEYSPDAILGFGILNSYLAANACQKNRIPFIYYWIDVLHRLIPAKVLQPLGKLIEHQTLKKTTRAIAINEKLGDYLVNLGSSRELTRIVRAGIDVNKYNPDISGALVRQQYQIDQEDKVLFFMGWLYNFSGLKEVILKIAQIPDKRIKLLVVGEGDAFEELKRICTSHDLSNRILLAGKKPYHEMPQFIAAADVCLLPSYPWEPIMQDIVPIKLYEYMAMKKPVISTKLAGVMREFSLDNGVIYVDKPEDVVNEAIDLLSKGNQIDLGIKALKFAGKNSWDKITDQFENILSEVIKEKSK